MNPLRLIAFTLALLPACISDALPIVGPTEEVTITQGFDATTQQAIIDAADEWSRATHGSVSLRLRIGDYGGDRHTIGPVYSDTEPLGRTARRGGKTGVHILLNVQRIAGATTPETYALGVKQIALHELMHAMTGVEDGGDGLMRALQRPGEASCIDAATVAAFCSVWGCQNGSEATCTP